MEAQCRHPSTKAAAARTPLRQPAATQGWPDDHRPVMHYAISRSLTATECAAVSPSQQLGSCDPTDDAVPGKEDHQLQTGNSPERSPKVEFYERAPLRDLKLPVLPRSEARLRYQAVERNVHREGSQ